MSMRKIGGSAEAVSRLGRLTLYLREYSESR
uniref:Uncharacterized protein n=1 Tax=Pyricularia oryzae (strain P131) TaxID=1143193 RepID=L7J201_PYRO1